MLSAIIATHESERVLVPTLAALVAGVTDGLLTEAIIADAGSRDGTRDVADVAGCRFLSSAAPLPARLREAAAQSRAPWLMFLRAGVVPADGWMRAVARFIDTSERENLTESRAAAFRPPPADDLARPALADLVAQFRAVFGAMPKPEHGLIISRRFYQAMGGHPDASDPEPALLRAVGRKRIAVLDVAARMRRDT